VMEDTYAGTPVIVKQKSTTYLPLEPEESAKSYQARLQKASYYNITKRTINTLVGIAFRKPMILGDDVDTEIRELCDDIDIRGNSLNIFAQEVAKAAIKNGHTFIMVEAPKVDRPMNVKEAKEMKLRPYWVHITPDRVINWRHTMVGSIPVLTQVSILETVTIPSGEFGQQVVNYTRVYRYDFDAGMFVWELRDEKMVTIDSGVLGTDMIPLIPIYSNKVGLFKSLPLLLDLAYMNIRHYQMLTDLHYHLHLCAVPMLELKNRSDTNEKFIVSANRAVDVDSDGGVRWIELAGGSTTAQSAEIASVEQRMYAMGISTFMRKAVERRTASENMVDFTTSYSDIQRLLIGMKDAFEQALRYTASLMNKDEGGSINISTDYNIMGADPQEMAMMLNYYTANLLPELEMRKYLDRNGLVSDEFDTNTPMRAVIPLQYNPDEVAFNAES